MARLLLAVIAMTLFTARHLAQAGPTQASITAPVPGAAIQGSVRILGATAVEGFQSYDLLFSYADEPAGSWFPLAHSEQAVSGSELGTWDTTLITDGRYNLLLIVHRRDGSQKTVLVEGLRVRNYTPIETDTPTPVASQLRVGTPIPTLGMPMTRATAAQVPKARTTATPLAPNPAEMRAGDVVASLRGGVLVAFSLFAAAGLYRAARNRFFHW